MKMVREVGVIGQVRTASGNPAALVVGCLLGGFVPAATYAVAHNEVQAFWSVATLLVLGGLTYSAKTVYQWGKLAFACSYKAAGFVLLVEGTMTLSKSVWLSVAALAYLVAINAVATGCQLAMRDMPPQVKVKTPKAEKPEVVVTVAEDVPAKPKRARKPRRVASESNPPDNTGEFEIPTLEQIEEAV